MTESLGQIAVAHRLSIPSGVDGVRGASRQFSDVKEAVSGLLDARFGAGLEYLRFPPVMPRDQLEKIGYFRNFPHLLGTVHCFCGGEQEHRTRLKAHDGGGDWTASQSPTDLVLTPAACYPVYPLLRARGAVPAGGWEVQVRSFCFRREPSQDPSRLQSFEMQEFVRVGSPEQVGQFRETWIGLGRDLLAELGLRHQLAPAEDPFFGRGGAVMKRGQREQALKFELLVPIGAAPVACVSFNHHLDHFTAALDMELETGGLAHSGCVGFGLERLTLALFEAHGPDPSSWPRWVRAALGL